MIFHYAYQLSCLTRNSTTVKGVLLFFDEYDAVAGTTVQHPQIRAYLLDNLTKYRDYAENLIIMAATNNYYEIDDASKREGRFDEHIYVRNLNEKEAKEILENMIENDREKGFAFDDDAFKEKFQLKSDDTQTFFFNVKVKGTTLPFKIKLKEEIEKGISFAALQKQYIDFKRELLLKSISGEKDDK